MFWKGKKETPAPKTAYCPWCVEALGEDGLCPACGRAAKDYEPEPFHLRPGTVLNGRYVLGGVLGRGLSGITYVCRDVRLERKAAVKEYYYIAGRDAAVSPAVVCDAPNEGARREFEDGKAWFRAQAMALARMEALPSVVGVSDFFEANDTEYMVMEFVEGATLKAHVEGRGRMPFGELMEAAVPLARDIAAMNGRYGVICRDITPNNIIRMPDGRLRLMGFMPADWPSHVFLTRGFAPIEQYSRGGHGPWTDVYSLCAVIYYCITGVVPVDAPDRAVTLHDGPDPLRPPSELGADIGPEQERALMKGLALMSKDRWQDADALLAALRRGLNEGKKEAPAQPAAACPPGIAGAEEDWFWRYQLLPGTVLNGRYTVEAGLYWGDDRLVYAAVDRHLGTRTAVWEYFVPHVMSREADGRIVPYKEVQDSFREGTDIFVERARTMAGLGERDGVMRVTDVFRQNGTAYAVTEPVGRPTLPEMAAQAGGRIPMDHLAAMMRPVMASLGELHRAGTIYRNIRPEGLVQARGGLCLFQLPFISRYDYIDWMDEGPLRTDPYTPIELYSQKGRGPWTDVYSLCAVIYYCITGVEPATAPARLGDLHGGPDPLRPPSELGAAIDPERERALMKGLALGPKDRWQDMDALQAALCGG